MRLRTGSQLVRRIATGLMLLAALAFVQQGALISASLAAAVTGFMPDPAVVLDGAIHFHDNLAQHVHVHAGDNQAGHVHSAADHDHDDADETGATLLWTLGCSSAVMPTLQTCPALLEIVGDLSPAPQTRARGVEPDGLTRP